MKYYFTFGCGQKYEGCYYVVSGKSFAEARKEMFEKFGKKWSMQYDEKQWICKSGKTQAEEYNLKEIK